MKIAIFGTTLHAGVMAALLAERGNDVFWCADHDYKGLEEQIVCQTYQEQDVNRLLVKQRHLVFSRIVVFLLFRWILKLTYFVLAQQSYSSLSKSPSF